MGKPYAQELEKLNEIYDWAKGTPIDSLSAFVKNSTKTPLYVIGSGGSFSATTFASLLHQHIGMIARCLTPLEFLEFDNIDNNCSVLIVTASGNNKDILSSFDRAVEINPKNLGILCASENNKLTKKAKKLSNVFIHAIKLPSGKDGFLATNSLIATLIWLVRAYIVSSSLPYEIPPFSKLITHTRSKQKLEQEITAQLDKFHNKETIILLYDNWGKTAAVDAESKLVEAGLSNVQLADFRNFAHGRHNWLDKNKDKTGLIALVNPQCKELAVKTLKLIPKYMPTASFSTKYEGPIASIALFIQVLYMVKFFGKIRNIDPGRPGVADFGRKIYHLSIPKKPITNLTDFEKFALRKKFGHCNPNLSETKMRIKCLQKFLKDVSETKFGSIVFDYDGTLCDLEHRFTQPSKEIEKNLFQLVKNNIILGIATGRGKSVRESLQKIIPKKFWANVFIGYYNCSEIGELGDNETPSRKPTNNLHLLEITEFLEKQKIISKQNITSRSKQITLENINFDAQTLVNQIQSSDPLKLENVKIVESTHSIDILSKDVSKLELVKFVKNRIEQNYDVLCIGDRGNWPGNDYELLSHDFSLSVDETSDDNNTCWNLVMNDIGEKGVLNYLSYGKIRENYIIFEKIGDGI